MPDEYGNFAPDEWIVWPVSDYTEWADRPPVTYEDEDQLGDGTDPPESFDDED